VAGPFEQFELTTLVPVSVAGLDLSFTNSSLWMVIAVGSATLLLTLSMRGRALVPSRWQSVSELMYEFIASLVKENVGSGGKQYFPFIFSVFMFVLFGNMLGMIPGSFTFTSHIFATFTLASVVFITVTIIGLVKHGTKFFSLFFPEGAPLWTAIILVPIELISYLSRPISLSVRLFANMTVGHVMLKVIAGFIPMMGVIGILPVVPALVAITALEFLIAFIQAYVFAILTCIYLHDAVHLH